MTAPITMESHSAPGDAISPRRPEVIIRGLDRRGYEHIGQTPSNAPKPFHGSSRKGGFSAMFTLVFKMAVLVLLKLNFAFMLLRYLYWLPRTSMDSLPDALFEISEVILSLAAVTGALSLWSYKSNMATLSTRYIDASEASGGFEPGQSFLRPPGLWRDKLIRPLLFVHALLGLALCFVSSFRSWTDEAQDSVLEAPTGILLNLFTTSQVYIAMTTYTALCLDVRRTMLCTAEELQRSYQSISHDALSWLHWKWEKCSRFLGDISHNFLGFVCTWYCYLFVRAVALITLLCTAVFSANGDCLAKHQLYVPTFELTYLLILCYVSDTLKATLLSPVEHLRELTLSRPTSEIAIHVEVQRFLHRIHKYLSMTLLKLSPWTETALKSFGLLIFALLLLHEKRVSMKVV